MAQKDVGPGRFHSLDALRGIAALAVVFWHWQHFFFEGSSLPKDFKQAQMLPMFDVLRIFYERGWLAVDLFFSLSGFIFFWLYADAINARRVSGQKYFILRFSRLYPLHLFTLLAVALEQIIYSSIKGNDFVYQLNDLRHFVLNLVLLPSVGLERGYSFNAPIWSVSVEVVLYTAFFTLCRVQRPRLPVLIGITFAAFVLDFYNPVQRGCKSFFLGGCLFYLYQILSGSRHARKTTSILAAVTTVMWIATIVLFYLGLGRQKFVVAVLFPCTILSLAMIEKTRRTFLSELSFLGDISYSSYLLHFPLQILFALVAVGLGVGEEFFSSGFTMAVFFVVLIGASQASYHWLEMPAQQYLRGRLLSRSPEAAPGPSAGPP